MNTFAKRILPMVLISASSMSYAAGLQITEQNASGIATSFAGSAAVAENASSLFHNPAGMTRLPGTQVSLGGVGLKTHVQSSLGGGEAGDTRFIPNAYFSMQLAPDWHLGLGISRPFGVSTDYAAGWAGAATAVRSEINTVNVNPALAYRLNDKVSLGFGLNYQKIDVDFTTSNVASHYVGDDAAAGWNAGALFTLSPAMRVGVAYRSAINHQLDGRLNGVSSGAQLRLPGTFTLSVWQQVSDRWEAMGDLSYTNWNRFDRSSVGLTAGVDYENAWRFAWGAAYKTSDALKLKFGLAYERAATRNGNLSLRAPEYDRLWLSAGVQWRAGKMGVFDLGYAYKHSPDALSPAVVGSGRYETGEHALGVQYSAGF